MYTIVDICGMQWKAEKGASLNVPKIDLEVGKKIEFNRVLLLVDKNTVKVGTPVLKDVVVKATVLAHARDKKVMVFKNKRRKTIQKKNGHRQDYTEIRIDGIQVGNPAAKKTSTSTAATEPKKTEPKTAEKPKTAVKPKTASKPKTETKPKTAVKPKAAAKPAAVKKDAKTEEK